MANDPGTKNEIDHEWLERAISRNLRPDWAKAMADGHAPGDLVLVGIHDATTPEVAPLLAVMTHEDAIPVLARAQSAHIEEMVLLNQTSLSQRMAESRRLGTTLMITVIVTGTGESSVQEGEGLSRGQMRGQA